MKRHTPLRADPAKTAAFHARGRVKGLRRSDRPPVARSTLKRSGGLKRARPKQRLVTPIDLWAAVILRDKSQCVWCRKYVRGVGHPHHLLPRQTWPQFNAERRNVVLLDADCHMQHEHSPNDRLPWAALPAECQAFLREVAAVDARAARFVRVKYPGAPT